MEQNATDLVMKFTLNNQAVWAECFLEVSPSDRLMKDFQRAADAKKYSNFFEVSSFDMGLALKEADNPAPNGKDATAPSKRSAFARWRSAAPDEYKSIFYPLEFESFSFSRVIDAASPIFFQACCTSQSFDSAVLVKRLSQGGEADRPTLAYLRIDFTKVLITGVSWEDGEMVKEKCDFICQGMKLTYKQQGADGMIGTSSTEATWPNPKNDRSLGIRK